MRRISGLIAIVGAVLALAACAPEPVPARPDASLLLAAATPAIPLWTIPLDVVGAPVVGDGVVATYVRTGHGGLEVRAYRLTDGGELWRREAVVGNEVQGIEVGLDTVRSGGRDLLTFLAPSPNWHPYELAVVHLATGRPVRIEQAAVQAVRRPAPCGDAVCFSGWALGTGHLRESARALKADLKSGRIAFDDAVRLPNGAFELGADVFAAPDGAGGQTLLFAQHGSIVWTVPYSRVLGKGAGTGGGWAWDRVGGLLVGSGSREAEPVDGVARIDLADQRTSALDPATGRVRWTLPHVGRCANDPEPMPVARHVIELCRFSGTGATAKDSVMLHFRGVRAERIGVDVRTGAVQWRHRAVVTDKPWTAIAGLSTGRWHPFQLPDRWVLLDRVTGATVTPAAGSVLGCAGARTALAAPNPEDDGKPGSYAAGTFLHPCGRGSTLSRFAVTSGGVDGGDGWWVAAGEHTLAAYEFGP